jgi:hypothetical protein
VGAWVLLTLVTLVVTTLGFVDAWADPRLLGSVVPDLAEDIGLGARFPMISGLIVPMVLAVALAGFVLWRRPGDPVAYLFSVMLVAVFAGLSPRASGAAFVAHPWTQPVVLVVWSVAYATMGWFLITFPDGRVWPRWTLLVPASMIGSFLVYPTFGAAFIHLPEVPPDRFRFGLAVLLLALGMTAAVVTQVVRYRRSTSPIYRQQIKWAVLPFLLFMVLGVVQFTSNLIGSYPRFNAVAMMLMVPVLLFMPVAWTWAILRYRLYEIDRILSRTIAYGLVVAVLAGVYGAGVLTSPERSAPWSSSCGSWTGPHVPMQPPTTANRPSRMAAALDVKDRGRRASLIGPLLSSSGSKALSPASAVSTNISPSNAVTTRSPIHMRSGSSGNRSSRPEDGS